MGKIPLLLACLVLAAGGVAWLAWSAQPRRVVVGPAVPIAGPDGGADVRRTPALHQVDHSAWDRLLQKYVDDEGMVDYAAWNASQTDRAALEHYLAILSRADPAAATTKAATLAFWINAYNALTVHGILEVYPTSSMRNHTARIVGFNIWDDLLLPVGAKQYSLNQIEHDILRKLGEPRIHFAIVCASMSCPRLLNAAYTPAELEEQLAANTHDFVSDEAFGRLLHAWFGNIARVLLPSHAFYIWGGYANCANYPPVLKVVGLYFSQAIIWDKEHPVLTRKDPCATRVEAVDSGWPRGVVGALES